MLVALHIARDVEDGVTIDVNTIQGDNGEEKCFCNQTLRYEQYISQVYHQMINLMVVVMMAVMMMMMVVVVMCLIKYKKTNIIYL